MRSRTRWPSVRKCRREKDAIAILNSHRRHFDGEIFPNGRKQEHSDCLETPFLVGSRNIATYWPYFFRSSGARSIGLLYSLYGPAISPKSQKARNAINTLSRRGPIGLPLRDPSRPIRQGQNRALFSSVSSPVRNLFFAGKVSSRVPTRSM